MPFADATPTRTPVKEPGPTSHAIASIARRSMPRARERLVDRAEHALGVAPQILVRRGAEDARAVDDGRLAARSTS